MLLRDPADGSISTARKRVAEGHFLDAAYPPARHATMILTPTLGRRSAGTKARSPAIQAYIDPVRRPLLVAGDSRSDWAMLFHSGGLRLWVDKNAATTAALARERRQRTDAETALKRPAPLAADRNWIIVTPAELAAP